MVLNKLVVHEQRVYLDLLELRFVLEVFQTRPRHEEDQHMHVLDLRPLLQQRKDLLHINIKLRGVYGDNFWVEHAYMVLCLLLKHRIFLHITDIVN